MRCAASFANPNGIATSSPRQACNACLGRGFGNGNNANRVVADVRRAGGNGWAATALGFLTGNGTIREEAKSEKTDKGVDSAKHFTYPHLNL